MHLWKSENHVVFVYETPDNPFRAEWRKMTVTSEFSLLKKSKQSHAVAYFKAHVTRIVQLFWKLYGWHNLVNKLEMNGVKIVLFSAASYNSSICEMCVSINSSSENQSKVWIFTWLTLISSSTQSLDTLKQ